jgi:hypothetical protein
MTEWGAFMACPAVIGIISAFLFFLWLRMARNTARRARTRDYSKQRTHDYITMQVMAARKQRQRRRARLD